MEFTALTIVSIIALFLSWIVVASEMQIEKIKKIIFKKEQEIKRFTTALKNRSTRAGNLIKQIESAQLIIESQEITIANLLLGTNPQQEKFRDILTEEKQTRGRLVKIDKETQIGYFKLWYFIKGRNLKENDLDTLKEYYNNK